MSTRFVTSRVGETNPPSTHSSSSRTTPFASNRASGQRAPCVHVIAGAALGRPAAGSMRAPSQALPLAISSAAVMTRRGAVPGERRQILHDAGRRRNRASIAIGAPWAGLASPVTIGVVRSPLPFAALGYVAIACGGAAASTAGGGGQPGQGGAFGGGGA